MAAEVHPDILTKQGALMTHTEQSEILTRELIDWLGAKPRTYGETMEAWGTHCPRFSIWEDSVEAGLVEVVDRGVRATRKGRALLRRTAAA